jgi:N6-adenosine-specific RNA methylase IME4
MKLNRDVLRKLPLALRIEIEENAQRKPLTQSELAAEQKRILDELRKHKAPGTRTDLKGSKATSEKDFSQVHATGIVGKLFNESHKQVEKRLAIVAAAEAEPERFGHLLEAMDRTGRVNSPYKRLKVAKQAELIRAEPPPLPGRGPYRVIVIDPPWPYEIASEESSIRGVWPYPTMSVAEICSTDVASIAHEDCILWLWTTNYHMQVVFDLLKAWRFQHRTILTWAKDHMGSGDWLRGQTEQCVVAVRGKPVVTLTNQSTLLRAPVRAHSQKPPEFYDLVESLCPAPRYADLFSRYQHNDKWDCHGDEAPDSYDPVDDTSKSVAEGLAAIRARKSAGGPGWGES